MKLNRTFILACIGICIGLPAFAGAQWLPSYSIAGTSPAYVAQGGALAAGAQGYLAFGSNPAGLADKDEVVHYSLDTWFSSDVETLQFLTNPSSVVSKLATRLSSTVASMSNVQAVTFWNENYGLMEQLYDLDANFPKVAAGNPVTEYDTYMIKQYFQTAFLASEYGSARQGQALIAFMQQSDFFGSVVQQPRSWMGGNFKLGLAMGTSRVKSGFGWSVGFATEFQSGRSLLSQHGGALDITMNFPLGYGGYVSPRVALGIDLRPEVRISTTIPNANFLNARFQDDIVALFTEQFSFGAGFAIDMGMNFQVNDNLRVSLVLRDVPALQHYVYTPLTQLAGIANGEWPTFYNDETVYFVPPDVAIGGQFKFHGAGDHEYVLNVEVSEVVSQFIWNHYYPERPFYVDDIIKVGFDMHLNEDLKLMLGYGNQFLSFGVLGDTDAGQYSASVSARVFRFEAGGSFSVNFRMAF